MGHWQKLARGKRYAGKVQYLSCRRLAVYPRRHKAIVALLPYLLCLTCRLHNLFFFALQVARWFFRVGGAAGTIAKSVSAYDMTISDSMYGAAKRCVLSKRIDTSPLHQNSLVDLSLKRFTLAFKLMSLV